MIKRKKIVAGNWKMQGSHALVEATIANVAALTQHPTVEAIIFPAFVYLAHFRHSGLHYGGQNCAAETTGAYTGEVSATMLKDVGCEAVIVGHSERRALYGETSELVAEKVVQAVRAGLRPILCVGETLTAREVGDTLAVLRAQLLPILTHVAAQEILPSLILAYEPVWAIGTGKTASPEIAEQTHSQIRAFVAEYDNQIAANLTILYGGSVKADNAGALAHQPNIDGFLVGGASLDPQQFLAIYTIVTHG